MAGRLVLLRLKQLVQIIIFLFPSPLRVALLRRILGFKIGKRVQFGLLSIVVVEDIEFGDDVIVDPLTFIYGLKKLSIGDRGRIAIFSKIYGCGELEMASRTLISVNCLIECRHDRKVVMADYSCFGPRNTIYTHGEYLPTLQGYPEKEGDVTIKNNSWTGMCTSILPGTEIGENTIIAPGAVLTGKIANNSFIRPRSYEYSVSPIEDKLDIHTEKETMSFILNTIKSVGSRNKQVDSELFHSKNINETLYFQSHLITYWKKDWQKCSKNREIIVGYNLPTELRGNKDLLWLDFSDYRYSDGSDVVFRLAQRLFLKYHLRFIKEDTSKTNKTDTS